MDAISATSLLERGRAAYAQRHWADAFDSLQQADAQAQLGRDDLERMVWSAGMLDRDSDIFATFERLYRANVEAGCDDQAAYWAFFYAFRLLALGEPGHASAWQQRAHRHAERHGGECATRGYLHLATIRKLLAAGHLEEAATLASEAIAVGERCSEPDLVAFAKCQRGRALARLGRVAEGVAQLDEAMLLVVDGRLHSPIMTGLVYCNLIETCRQVFVLGRSREWTTALSEWCGTQPQSVQFHGRCMVHRAELLEIDGAWSEAVDEAQRAIEQSTRAVAGDTRSSALYQQAEIRRLRGEHDAAEQDYRAASQLGLDPQPGLALLRLAQGHTDQAAAALRRALATLHEPLARARLLPACVEVLLAAGAHDEAVRACVELEGIATRYDTDVLRAIAAQARGDVELGRGDGAAAIAPLRAAFAIWRRVGAPYIEARLRVRIGEACSLLGDSDGATLERDAARLAFERLGARPEFVRLGAPAHRDSPDRGLTTRELQVLGLVAAGQTNKAIARSLQLSDKTIDRHLSNIFDKLGVSSRAAATAYAYQHRLL